MQYGRNEVLAYLADQGIVYKIKEHPPLFTVADAHAEDANILGAQGTKNLFLKGVETGRYYLYVIPETARADLKLFATAMGEKKVTFGDANALLEYLGITPGAVSLCCLLNDESRRVTCVVDAGVLDAPLVSMHPNDNTATIALTHVDLGRFFGSLHVVPVRL